MSNRIVAGICLLGLLTCGVCLLAGTPSTTTPPARVSSLYDRIGAKLEANPDLAKVIGQPTKELQSARWMVGSWAVTAHVFKTASAPERIDRGEGTVQEILGGTWLQLQDSYDGETDDLGLLTFDPASKRWVSVGIDKTGNAVVSTAERWDGNRLELIAPNAAILGEHVVLRQTIEKRSASEYHVLNEERLADGSWAAIDEYTYVKK
jgi:uncharacterized protein DUF1579